MSEAHFLHTEIVPTEQDLRHYEGLRNIRLRKEGDLVIGLFLRSQDKQTVVTIDSPDTSDVVSYPVERARANEAFEQPWESAPPEGKMVLINKLAPSTLASAS